MHLPRSVALLLSVCVTACASPSVNGDGGVDVASADAPVGPTVTSPLEAGALYARMCASCHGDSGEGGLGPRLIDTPRSLEALTANIDATMPSGNPAACRDTCASTLAAFIKNQFTTAQLACDAVPPSARALRLLNRRELRNTIRDLLAPAIGTASAEPCNVRTFTYDPSGRTLRSVALAGSFNAWSTTAWPLAYDAATSRWTLRHELPDGSHQYKFVLDGTDWVRDPRNPDTAPDGFGGQNSVLTISCTPGSGGGALSAGLPLDPAASLPVETRPEGFVYDTHATANLVTSVHVQETLRTARALVDTLGPRVMTLVPCTPSGDGAACAEQFVRAFGRRAFRRPLRDDEVTRYRALVTGAGDFSTGVRRAVRAFVLSPNLLYRSEMGEAQSGGAWRLTPHETASALSYLFWATSPDDALSAVADDGSLARPEVLEREARRLLADPRARDQFGAFALQWLGVESVASTPRSATLYPDFLDPVRASMLEESRRFVVGAVFDGTHRFDELLTADWSMLDATLARFYGVDGVTGTAFQRVTLPASRRGGVLAQGSVMVRYAHSDQSSPILRGAWVRRTLLCQDFPPPPPNAGGVPDVDPSATTRQRFAQHTSNAACRTCHQYIDNIGFGFERFDAVGRPRATENGMAIDAQGDLNDSEGFGTNTHVTFDTPAALGAALARSERAQTCFVRQYWRFSRGAQETAQDLCAVRQIAQRFRAASSDVRELMVAVVTSPDFLRRR